MRWLTSAEKVGASLEETTRAGFWPLLAGILYVSEGRIAWDFEDGLQFYLSRNPDGLAL